MELLAPVGYKDALKAAVVGGADAVYLAGKDFGARRLADNFNDDELRGAVKFAHDHKVRVYVTVNTLIKEAELNGAVSFLETLKAMEVDAFIIQDRGLMRYALDDLGVPVHASTQMGIHDLDGALWAEEQGLDRIILSRELDLDHIRKIKEGSKIGLEVFVHGALCYCFSGGCLFSSMLGGRSGNRGLCAQPCRKKYKMGEDEGYFLSTADTFGIDAIPELIRIGVRSLKIEGRMRSPQYVYLASKVYSAAIKRAEEGKKELITQRERELLETVFNRGFSRGYLMDQNVVQSGYADSRGLPIGRATSDGNEVKFATDLIKTGDGVTFYRGGQKVGGFEVRSPRRMGQMTVVNSPFQLPPGEYHAYKTKDREFAELEKNWEGMRFSSMRGKPIDVEVPLPVVSRPFVRPELSFYVNSLSVMEAVLPYADRIYYEMNRQADEAKEICEAQDTEFVLMLPRITPDIPDVEAPNIMACTVGQMHKYRDRRLYGHYSLNYFNSLTVPKLHQYTLSLELSRLDIEDICKHTQDRLEVLVFGRAELMVSRDPGLKEGMMVDEKNKRFQTYRDTTGLVHVLNSSDMFLLDHLNELESMGVSSFALDVRRRHPDLAKLAADVFSTRDMGRKMDLKQKCGPITAAHYENGVS